MGHITCTRRVRPWPSDGRSRQNAIGPVTVLGRGDQGRAQFSFGGVECVERRASPLGRVRETLALAAEEAGLRHHEGAFDDRLREMMERWWKIGVPDKGAHANQAVIFTRQLWNMLELARVITAMVIGAASLFSAVGGASYGSGSSISLSRSRN